MEQLTAKDMIVGEVYVVEDKDAGYLSRVQKVRCLGHGASNNGLIRLVKVDNSWEEEAYFDKRSRILTKL